MIQKLIFSCMIFASAAATGQSSGFTLRQCIDYAWLNNPDVRQSVLSRESAGIDQKQSRTVLLPSLSANAGQNYQFGRSIDRFTNQFSRETIRSNNIGISGSMVLYNGLQNQNNIRQKDELAKAAAENTETVKNQIALNVANAFLQTIQAAENIRNAEFQMESTRQRIDRAQKMVDAGTADLSALLSLKAQLANEQLNLVTARNSKNNALISLKTLMQMPADQELELQIPPSLNLLPENGYSVSEIYAISLQNMPQVKAAMNQYEAAVFQTRMSRGLLSPTLSLYGSLSTVYSQSAKTVTGLQPAGTQIIGYTQNGNESVLQPVFNYQVSTIPFKEQLSDNLGQSAGLTLSWNLFNGFQVHNQIQKARINTSISELNLMKTRNSLLNEISAAVSSYDAAKARLEAALNNTEAQKLSYEYVQKRYDAGASTSFDFIQAKNNYLQALGSETQARFELVFRSLILEYYKGNPIQL